jgi:hypothetical protein
MFSSHAPVSGNKGRVCYRLTACRGSAQARRNHCHPRRHPPHHAGSPALQPGAFVPGAAQRVDSLHAGSAGRPGIGALVESGSNDTWFLSGETVLQVCYRGDVDRLVREAELLVVLPGGVPGPVVLDYGRDRLMSWIVVKRVHAGSLWRAWRSETGAGRRSYVRQLAQIMRSLHSWQPPAQVLARYAAAECPEAETDPVAIAASTLTPLSAGQLGRLIEHAASWTSRSGTPASRAAVMNACLSVWGVTALPIPARRAILRTIRPAPWRSSRCPSAARNTGPSVRSPTARSIAWAVRGTSGMVTTLPPLRVIVSVRCAVGRRPVPQAPRSGDATAGGVELGQDVRYMDAGGLRRDEELGGDVTIAAALADQA